MADSAAAAPKGQSPMRRLALATGILAGLLIAGLVATQLLGVFSSASTRPTIWQAITAGITDGTVPKDVALEAFAYLYQVDIPGVTVPKGEDAADKPTSGLPPEVGRRNWDALTPDQQAVYTRVSDARHRTTSS